MKNKTIRALSALVMLFALSHVQHHVNAQEQDIRVRLDNEFLSFDQPPVVVNDRTMVPFRGIFEAFGADVDFNEATRQALATLEDTTVIITVEQNSAIVNGQFVALDAPAFIMEETGRTLVPLRFIAEAFDAEVDWLATERIVSIERAAQAPAGNFMVSAVPNNTLYGSVSVTPSGLGLSPGATITVTANPTANHTFSRWNVLTGGVTLGNTQSATFIMPANNVSIQAVFEPSLALNAQPNFTQRGRVEANPAHGTAVQPGQIINLNAVANTGYSFVRWETTINVPNLTNATTPSISFSMPDTTVGITAVFEAVSNNALTISRNNTQQGDVSVQAQGWQQNQSQLAQQQQTGNIAAGTSVTLTASPRSGFEFYRWNVVAGGINIQNPTNNTLTFTMPSNSVSIRADFRPITSAINLSLNINNSGDIGVAAGSPTTPTAGQTVVLTAIPRSGFEFVRWVATSPSNLSIQNASSTTSASFVMPNNTSSVSLQAEFRQAQNVSHQISISSSNESMGFVHQSASLATQGQTISISASPHSGFRFSHWVLSAGAIPNFNSSAPNTSFTMPDSLVIITAHFIQE